MNIAGQYFIDELMLNSRLSDLIGQYRGLVSRFDGKSLDLSAKLEECQEEFDAGFRSILNFDYCLGKPVKVILQAEDKLHQEYETLFRRLTEDLTRLDRLTERLDRTLNSLYEQKQLENERNQTVPDQDIYL